jgi:thioredoxin domain-containing protein 10
MQSGNLWNSYFIASENNQAHGYFYATSKDVAGKQFFIDQTPVIVVYKENTHYTFPLSDAFDTVDLGHLNKSLHSWISQEKFSTFPRVIFEKYPIFLFDTNLLYFQITRENLHQFRQTKKYLVLAVVEENKLNEIHTHELEFKDMIEQIIRTKRSKYHDHFQFGWVGNPDLSHSIAMETLNTPHLIVLNSTTNEHHIPDDDPLEMTPEAVEIFLQSILNESNPKLGGDWWHIRTKRAFYELKRLLREMWKGNPILTCVIFGLPMGFLSLICYSIFCADILDADPEDEDGHEKKE